MRVNFMKKQLAKILCGCILLSVVQLGMFSAVNAADYAADGIMDAFKTKADVAGNCSFSLENYQQTPTDGSGQSTSKVSMNWIYDTNKKSAPESDGTYWRIDFSKGNCKAVKARYNRRYDNVIHSFTPGTKTILETKFFYPNVYIEAELFGMGTDGGGAWASNGKLLTLKAQNEPNREWLLKDINNNTLISLDDSDYQTEGKRDDAKLRAAWENRWHHFYIELESMSDNKVQYTVYHNGKKLNETPIEFGVAKDAIDKNATGINQWINYAMNWGDGYVMMDDLGVQPLTDLALHNGTVVEGQIGVDPATNRIMLDFNNLLKEDTISNITLQPAAGSEPNGLVKTTDAIDKTRLVLELEGGLTPNTEYILDYSGLQDIYGNSVSNGSITFTTGAALTAEKITPYTEKHFDSQSEIEHGTVEDGVLHISVNGSGVEAANTFNYENEIHTFADPSSATVMELKLKTKETGNMRKIFNGGDTAGLWWEAPIVQDQYTFRSPVLGKGYTTDPYGKIEANKWYHVYMVARGNTYDYYIDGVKMNAAPINFVHAVGSTTSLPVEEAGVTGIQKLRFSHKVWGEGESWWDDVVVQKMAALQLNRSSIEDNAAEVPVSAATVMLDFNNLLDVKSIENIKLFAGDTEKKVTASVLQGDTTQVEVNIPAETLEYNSTYEIRYSGLKDRFGTTADGKLTFSTLSMPVPAVLKSSNPAENSVVGINSFTPSFTFDRSLNPSTVLPENITITAADSSLPAVNVERAEIVNNNQTIKLSFDSNLLAGKEYTITFGDAVKIADADLGIDENSKNFSFRTVANINAIENEFENLIIGSGGLSAVEGNFKIDRSDPDSFLQDTARVTLDVSPESSLIFDLGEAGDYSFDFFDIDYASDSKAQLFVSESADGQTFTTPVRLVVSPEANEGFIPSATEAVPEHVEHFPNGPGVQDLWRYSGKLTEGNRYLKITMKASKPEAKSWTPRIRNIKLNQQAGSAQGLISSVPSNGEQTAKRTRSIILDFDAPLYTASVNKDSFSVTVNGTKVENVDRKLNANGRQLVLTLLERMGSQEQYVVTPKQVYNVYGTEITQTITFTTEKAEVTLFGTALLDIEGNAAEFGNGSFTPQFTLHNYTASSQKVALIAAVYHGLTPENIITEEVEIAPGEQVVKFSKTLTVNESEGKILHMFAWKGFDAMQPLPNESIGIVDNNYFPEFVRKAITLSYDDGPQYSDRQMIEYMDQYGVRGTFNVNSNKLSGMSDQDKQTYAAVYRNHEIANHTKSHPRFNEIELSAAQADILSGKQEAEQIFGTAVRGFAYPYNRMYGSSTEREIVEYLKESGHAYGRPSKTNGSFTIPEDFQDWKFTCHHIDANFQELQEQFYNLRDTGEEYVFSVWGHSWEFAKSEDNSRPTDTWETILIPFLQGMQSHEDEIWNPTNIEFYDYIQAQRDLQIEQSSVYNPGDVAVYITIDGEQTVVPPGSRIYPD